MRTAVLNCCGNGRLMEVLEQLSDLLQLCHYYKANINLAYLILKDAQSVCSVCLFPCWHHAIAPAVGPRVRARHER